MAPKRSTPMEEEDPPVADSTTEEEEGSSSDSSSDSSSEEPPKPSSPPKKPETTATPQPKSSSESEESDSDESDSEKAAKPTGALDPIVKPIATKPMEETPKTTKPRSKPAASPAKSTAKRAINNDTTEKKDPKKAKKGSGSGSGSGQDDEDDSKQLTADPKKQLFQRLWSEEDEIAMLKGLIEYAKKGGGDPDGFLDYIKNSLHFDVTKAQLNDKIRRLKKKYENNLARGKKGEDPTFSKPHEHKAYELSKKVWGGEAVESSPAALKFNGKARTPRVINKASAAPKLAELAASPEGKKVKIEEDKGESQSEMVLFDKNVGFAGMDEFVVKHGLELVEGSKRAELEERWRKLQLAQLELFVERSELVFDQAKLMLEAAKKV